jgi:hypothetical protein
VNGTLRGDGAPASVLAGDVLESTFGTADGGQGHDALAD